MRLAPGAPGIAPRWTSSAKSGIGTSLSALSRVWFTLSHGILNEVYYPRVDQACIRDFGLIVTGDGGFFAEEKRDCRHAVYSLEGSVPAYHLVNESLEGRFRIEKDIVTDPRRDVVLCRIRLLPADPGDRLRLYALLAPHLVNGGAHNTGWAGDYKGIPMLFASGAGTALALAADTPWVRRSAGFVGVSDGWQDLKEHGQMTWEYERADDGNVSLCAEFDSAQPTQEWVVALAFGRSWAEAAFRARASLADGFALALSGYCTNWHTWHASLRPLDDHQASPGTTYLSRYRVSTAVVRCHESPAFPGGLIASLSIPWGYEKGDNDLGGYHLVWPRDLAESAGALLAAGALQDAVRVLDYFSTTQEADGRWAQNQWLDGTPYWQGTQMDECAFPILIVDLALREGALRLDESLRYWPMVKKAASFILRYGPATGQDRWEEDGGYSPFTLAVEIAGLLAAADLADAHAEPAAAVQLRACADAWNAEIENWTYVAGTRIAEEVGVPGYYVRIAPPETAAGSSPVGQEVLIRNRDGAQASQRAEDVISPDALALVRFGLRAADDPRIVATMRVIDARLKVEFPTGPAWRRYSGDGYGEHDDGAAFDGVGVGRPWPLLTGERAHVEIAGGRTGRARELLATLESFAGPGVLLPEQIWDGPPIPERELEFGRPSGSAMPLVWAHAEHIKLLRSLADGRVFDMPPQTVARYPHAASARRTKLWRMNSKSTRLPQGCVLRLEMTGVVMLHWAVDNWDEPHDVIGPPLTWGLSVIELPTEKLTVGQRILFTWRTEDDQSWLGEDFQVTVVAADPIS